MLSCRLGPGSQCGPRPGTGFESPLRSLRSGPPGSKGSLLNPSHGSWGPAPCPAAVPPCQTFQAAHTPEISSSPSSCATWPAASHPGWSVCKLGSCIGTPGRGPPSRRTGGTLAAAALPPGNWHLDLRWPAGRAHS